MGISLKSWWIVLAMAAALTGIAGPSSAGEEGGSGLLRVDRAFSLGFGRPLVSIYSGLYSRDFTGGEDRFYTLTPGVTLGLGGGFEGSASLPLEGLSSKLEADPFDRRFDIRHRDLSARLRWTAPLGTLRLRAGVEGLLGLPLGDTTRASGTSKADPALDTGVMGLVTTNVGWFSFPIRVHVNAGYLWSRDDGAFYTRSHPVALPISAGEGDGNDLALFGLALETGLRRMSVFAELTTEQFVEARGALTGKENLWLLTPGLRTKLTPTIELTAGVSFNLSSDDTDTAFDPGEVFPDYQLRLGLTLGDILARERAEAKQLTPIIPLAAEPEPAVEAEGLAAMDEAASPEGELADTEALAVAAAATDTLPVAAAPLAAEAVAVSDEQPDAVAPVATQKAAPAAAAAPVAPAVAPVPAAAAPVVPAAAPAPAATTPRPAPVAATPTAESLRAIEARLDRLELRDRLSTIERRLWELEAGGGVAPSPAPVRTPPVSLQATPSAPQMTVAPPTNTPVPQAAPEAAPEAAAPPQAAAPAAGQAAPATGQAAAPASAVAAPKAIATTPPKPATPSARETELAARVKTLETELAAAQTPPAKPVAPAPSEREVKLTQEVEALRQRMDDLAALQAAPAAPAPARPAEISIPITVPTTTAPSGKASLPPAIGTALAETAPSIPAAAAPAASAAAEATAPAATTAAEAAAPEPEAAAEPGFPLAVGDTMALAGWAWTEEEPVAPPVLAALDSLALALTAHREVQLVLLVHGGGSDREAELSRTAAAAQYLRAYLVSAGADSAQVQPLGMGLSEPLVPIDAPDAVRNARVEVARVR